jgi:thioredoxin reductase (NADPH)
MPGTTPYSERHEQMFPKLDARQIARIAHFGSKRKVARGEVLFEAGEVKAHFFVVVEGTLEVVSVVDGVEKSITIHEPGEFTGEVDMLSGRQSLARGRMREDGEVIVVDRADLRGLVQTDAELSEIFMRAFILRRMALIELALGDVLIGSRHSPDTLRLREFLTRNGHPYTCIDVERDPSVQELLDRFHVRIDEVPVLICRGKQVLRNPANHEVADCLGLNPEIDETALRDVVIVGAGLAGLAAAVYAASEGLDVLVVETQAPGGQAGSSSKIENYLGFPTGISGRALAGRAFTQAEKFGTEVLIARGAAKLACRRTPYAIDLAGGGRVHARSIIIASGARYRRLPLDNLSQFEGAGVYYAATHVEAQLCAGEEVVVVGGGNSAGQAAVFLSGTVRHVHMLVRGSGLPQTMSRYLIRRIEESPTITLRTHTQIEGLEGVDGLERVRWRNAETGEADARPVRHIFVMTGADPNTAWLEGCVALDEKGFVKTGADLHAEDLTAQRWSLARAPYMFETSSPGVFAVGDVRSGSVKRVASAVGEGSICVQLVHKVLAP